MAGTLAAGFIRERVLARLGTTHLILTSIVLLSVFEVTSVWLAPDCEIATGFADDAYYYFRIARNIVNRGAVTFDGETATNGFHPLWMTSVLPAFLASRDRIMELRLVATLSVLLIGTAAFAGARAAMRDRPPLVGAVCALFLLRYARDFSMMGMETGILLPLAILALLQARDISGPGSGRARLLRLGITLLFVSLSRLDAAILAGLMVTFLAFSRAAAAMRRDVILLAEGPTALGLIILMTVNRAVFGRFLSVSGSVKTSFLRFNDLFFEQLSLASPGDPKSLWGVYHFFVAVAATVLARSAAQHLSRAYRHVREPGSADPVELAVCANIILYTLFYLFNSTWRLWQWYVWPAFLVAAFALPGVLEWVARPVDGLLRRLSPPSILRVPPVAFSAGLVVLAVVWGVRHPVPDVEGFKYRNLVIAEDLNDALHDSDIVAMGDMAGSFSFFFEGGVIQMEGLVGDGRMLDAVESGLLSQYLDSRGADYVLSHEGPRGMQDYGDWELLVPEATESSGPQSPILVSSADEIMRWESEEGSTFLWRLDGQADEATVVAASDPGPSEPEALAGGRDHSSKPVGPVAVSEDRVNRAGSPCQGARADHEARAPGLSDRSIEPRSSTFPGGGALHGGGASNLGQQPVVEQGAYSGI